MATPIITRQEAISQGLNFYFTGVMCKRGHLSKRNATNSDCIECVIQRKFENKEYLAKKKKLWDIENKEHIQEYNFKNRQRILNKKTEYRIKNKEKFAEATARYRRNNREKYLSDKRKYNEINYEKNKDWWKKNKIVAKVYKSRRRDNSIQNTIGLEHFTKKDAEILREIQKDKCANCKIFLNGCGHLDHIMPLYLGGPNSKDNLQWLCKKCNLSKGAKHPIDWAQQNGRLL